MYQLLNYVWFIGPVVQGSQSDNNKSRTPVSKLYTMCFICGKQLSNHYNLRVHMETHQNAQYACSVCSHVSRSRDALRKHVSYRHPRPNNNNTTTDNSSTVDSSHNVNKLPSTWPKKIRMIHLLLLFNLLLLPFS